MIKKIKILVFGSILIFSCTKNKKKPSSLNLIDQIKVEFIDDIPFLIRCTEVDSVYEIIVKGEVNFNKPKDTLNSYYKSTKDKNKIHRDYSGMMCCSETFVYDSTGLLIKKNHISDTFSTFHIKWSVSDNKIFELSSNGGDKFDTINIFKIKNDRLISKKSNSEVIIDFSNNIEYIYNTKRQLVQKIEKLNYRKGFGENNQKIIKSYHWNNTNLISSTEQHIIYWDDIKNTKSTQTIIIEYDSIGFPKFKTIIDNHKKIVLQTKFIKNTTNTI